MKTFMVARSYRVLLIEIKSLIVGALVNLETRFKSPQFGRFLKIFAFVELSVLAEAINQGH